MHQSTVAKLTAPHLPTLHTVNNYSSFYFVKYPLYPTVSQMNVVGLMSQQYNSPQRESIWIALKVHMPCHVIFKKTITL
jgi:hypothetical protein